MIFEPKVSSDTIIAAATLVFQVFVLIIAIRQYRHFTQKQVETIMLKLTKVMSRGMGGIYIPFMSEEAGEQLKASVRRILEEELNKF